MTRTLMTLNPDAKIWSDEAGFHVDVRPVLFNGGEPFSCVVNCANQLVAGDSLIIHTPFEAKPLVNQLVKMGFEPLVKKEIDMDHWTVLIKK